MSEAEEKIRVLEIIEATTGGTRRHLYYLLTRLDPRRYSVSLVYSNARDRYFAEDLREFRARGVTLFEVPMRREISPLRDLMAFFRIIGILLRGRYDLVHAHSSKAGFLGRLAAKAAGVRAVVYSPHSFAFQYEPGSWAGRYYRLLERLASRFHDKLLCVSEGERRVALQHGLARRSEPDVIENAIPDPVFVPRRRAHAVRAELGIPHCCVVVGTVAQFRRQKGLNHFLAAIPIILASHPSTFFVLVGSGPLLSDIRRQVELLGLKRSVALPGHSEHVWDYYGVMDIFALVSLWEGMPYAILEAMASGLPIVATDTVGNNELVRHEENGLLVPPANPEAIAEAVGRLLIQNELRAAFGRASRALFERRSAMEEWIRRYETLYEAVARGAKAAAPAAARPARRTSPPCRFS